VVKIYSSSFVNIRVIRGKILLEQSEIDKALANLRPLVLLKQARIFPMQ
jgi:hypothetical protein